MIKCPRCHSEKTQHEFTNEKEQIMKQCNNCREKSKKRIQENEDLKAKQLSHAKNWRDKNKERITLYNEHQRLLKDEKESDWNTIKHEHNLVNVETGKPSPRRIVHTTINDIVGKICSGCQQWKALTDYNKYSKSWDNLKTTCMKCMHNKRMETKERQKLICISERGDNFSAEP